jgi:phosphoglycolate phosphatase-like HAD superfamily hydrolase
VTVGARAVVLWDIDGTLMRTPGVGVRAFVQAVERVTGVVWTPHRLDFGGRTDPDIAARILEDAGVTDMSLVPAVLDALVVAYEEMADELRVAVRVLPGVESILSVLGERDAVQTVVTGNLRAVAHAKVAAGDLARHLHLDVGGYGSDHAERAELVRLALERVTASGAVFRPDDVWVVGDTPRDLACARANGVRCALVATGTFDAASLRPLGADVFFEDLSDATAFLGALALD